MEALLAMADVEGDGHLFCYALQLKTWYKMSVDEIEDVVKERDMV